MIKAKFKNHDKRAEINTIEKVQSRKFLEKNEQFLFYAILASVEISTQDYYKKYADLLLDSQVNKMKRLVNSSFNFMDKLNNHYKNITEENAKIGFMMYVKLLEFYNKRQRVLVDLNENYEEEKDLKIYYIELNYAYKILEAVLEDGKMKDEWITKYFHYYSIQIKSVINWIEKEVNNNPTRLFNYPKFIKEYRKQLNAI